ncbi:MAG: carboxymuconolactone decarboxylase family protein [Candidatus Eisenbacteria bacterium]|nr:carboxymuconolactone decarboxylase family protein [Candidatus Eisenbacteria bacterium]
MQARMRNPVAVVPGAMEALHALSSAVQQTGLPAKTARLMELRASQINGDAVCVDGHPRVMKKEGETDERIFAVAAWRQSPYFSEAERAALGLAEAITRLSGLDDPVPDGIWKEAARHYDERELAGLVLTAAVINVWNRLNIATRQIAGEWKP